MSAFIGYLVGYLRKKGENLATHEDVDKLVEQVSAVTTATKEIESKISGDLWNAQKRWEMKREVMFEAAKRIVEVDNALLGLDAPLRSVENVDSPVWEQARFEKMQAWKRGRIGLMSRCCSSLLLVARKPQINSRAWGNSQTVLRGGW